MHECPVTGVWHQRTEVVGVIISNGTLQYRRKCLDCFTIGTQCVAKKDIDDITNVVIVEDRREHCCERCGVLGAENHHWAPWALFKDASKWPTSYLCPFCHREWHRVMTPQFAQAHREPK